MKKKVENTISRYCNTTLCHCASQNITKLISIPIGKIIQKYRHTSLRIQVQPVFLRNFKPSMASQTDAIYVNQPMEDQELSWVNKTQP